MVTRAPLLTLWAAVAEILAFEHDEAPILRKRAGSHLEKHEAGGMGQTTLRGLRPRLRALELHAEHEPGL
jgi:hypothetical protein